MVDENRGENREGWFTDKTREKETNREPRKGLDASLAKAYLDSVEEDIDEEITAIGIPECNDTDQDNNTAPRARVHTPQGTVAEEMDKDYIVNELSTIFKITNTKLENTNLGNPSWKEAIRLGDPNKRRSDKRIKKGCIVWIPVAHYTAFKGELSKPHKS